jgi:hypothetical protein
MVVEQNILWANMLQFGGFSNFEFGSLDSFKTIFGVEDWGIISICIHILFFIPKITLERCKLEEFLEQKDF